MLWSRTLRRVILIAETQNSCFSYFSLKLFTNRMLFKKQEHFIEKIYLAYWHRTYFIILMKMAFQRFNISMTLTIFFCNITIERHNIITILLVLYLYRKYSMKKCFDLNNSLLTCSVLCNKKKKENIYNRINICKIIIKVMNVSYSIN